MPAGEGGAGAAAAPRSTGGVTVFGELYLADVARRLDDEGPSPGLEVSRFLARTGAAAPVPALAGSVEYAPRGGRAARIALVVLRAFVPAESDGLSYATTEVHRFLERALARGRDGGAPAARGWDVNRLLAEDSPAEVRDALGAFLDAAHVLGAAHGRALVRALAATRGGPARPGAPDGWAAFAPEPWSSHDQRDAYQSMRNLAGRCLREIERSARSLPPGAALLAARVLARRDEALRRFGALLVRRPASPRTRQIGALDLGKVVHAGNDFVFVDLDGDRRRPAAERRRKGSPLRDAAGMVRSLHEATFSALLDPARVRAEDVEAARPWARVFWEASASAFLKAYVAAAGAILPGAPDEIGALFDAFLQESAFGALAAALDARAPAPSRQEVGLGLLDALLGSKEGSC